MAKLEYIIEGALRSMLIEAPKQQTDNAPSAPTDSPFTPAEEKFLGKFDAYGSTHLGIIYSPSDIGIREFITRSGVDLNLSPGVLVGLIRKGIIKIVPYTGYGLNTDYTLELQLSLDDVAGLGAEDKKEIEAGSDASGAPAPEAPMPPAETPPAPELAWVVRYGDILKESVAVAHRLINEAKKEKPADSEVHLTKTRVLKRLPKQYIRQLERIMDAIIKTSKTTFDKERMIADILDNLQVNFELTPRQIKQAYDFHRNQRRLQKELDKTK